jgi:hypothetical protein
MQVEIGDSLDWAWRMFTEVAELQRKQWRKRQDKRERQ